MRLKSFLVTIALISVFSIPQIAAAKTTVTGKLSKKGYLVAGLTPKGESVTFNYTQIGKKFKLPFKKSAKKATLSLIKSNGKYYGPVVLAVRGKKACIALSGKSADLGKVRVKKGYAIASKGRRAAAKSCKAKMKNGKVTGAGKMGLVSGAGTSGNTASVKALAGEGSGSGNYLPQGQDPDNDGLVNAFDADDNNNGVLDNQDPFNENESGGIFSTLYLGLNSVINANIATVSQQDIDNAIKQNLNLVFYYDQGAVSGNTQSASVNCFSLPYCSTATASGLSEVPVPAGTLWSDYNGGYGLAQVNGQAWGMGVMPNATTSQIGPGDTYEVNFDTSNGRQSVTRALSPYFVTTPAITSFGGIPMIYPYTGDQGLSESNPIQLPPDALSALAITAVRPQRVPVPGAESGSLIDMGRLNYGVVISTQTAEYGCAGHYSGLSSTLTEQSATSDPYTQLFPLADSADDGVPNSSNTISMTVNLQACLQANGQNPAGQTYTLAMTAVGEPRPGGVDRAAETLYVKFPS